MSVGKARKFEWAFWNLAACGLWVACLVKIPDAWPMLFLVLPFQACMNLLLIYLFKRSRLTALATLGTIAAFAGWLLTVRYRMWETTALGLSPLCRILWQIWVEHKELLLGRERR